MKLEETERGFKLSFGDPSQTNPKSPLDELRGQYARAVSNVVLVGFWSYFWLDASWSGQSQWFPALFCFLSTGFLIFEWKRAHEMWNLAKSRYEPAGEPQSENLAP